ncbi:MAG: hypothetical protein HKN87_06225 [Saprospiraceae bacterium]|nr:hypothetical protein [Saprospiraceae bacterium]
MLKDYGHYSLDYSDLANIRWQFERQYEMVINQPSDVDILKNVIIETNNQDKEKLIQANTWIKRSAGGGKHYPMDSFKMQPFDAIWTEYLLTAEDLKVGDTLMVRYKIQADITTTLHEWTLQYAYPVRESRVSFIIPEAFSYADHVTDRQYLQSERTLDSTIVIGQGLSKARIPQKGLVMTFKDIPAYKVEIFGPPLIELRPAFLLNITEAFVGQEGVFLPPWSEQFSDLAVGDFFGKQYRVKLAYRWLSDAASKILSTNYSDRLFVLKLYEFIHQRFSWDGSFGLFPSRTIADMRSEKSVNKSAMNMALLALLNEAGFDAYPVLVTTTDQRPVYEEIPSVNQFNHFVIEVNLDDGKLYVDAGIPTLPPGWIDAGIRKDRAIQIKNYKGNWITIPEAATSSNLDIKMNVKGDYSATGTIHASFTGYDAFSERNQLRDDPTGHYWKQRAEALSPSIRIDSVKYVHVKNLNRPFENIVHFHIEPSDDQAELVINSVPYSFFNQVYFIDSLRANPIMFPLKIVEHTELTILKDPNLKVVSAPQAQKLRLEGNPSNMAFLISDTNSQFQSNFNIQFSKRKFSQVEYNALKTYLSKVSDLIAKPLVITK